LCGFEPTTFGSWDRKCDFRLNCTIQRTVQCVSFSKSHNLLTGVVQTSIDNMEICEYIRNSEPKRYREPPTLPNRYSCRTTKNTSPNDPRMGGIRRSSTSEDKRQAILFKQRLKPVAVCSEVDEGTVEQGSSLLPYQVLPLLEP